LINGHVLPALVVAMLTSAGCSPSGSNAVEDGGEAGKMEGDASSSGSGTTGGSSGSSGGGSSGSSNPEGGPDGSLVLSSGPAAFGAGPTLYAGPYALVQPSFSLTTSCGGTMCITGSF
jgi:hypothetical protein